MADKKHRVYNDKASCSGCSACYSICPTKAITMHTDERGFSFPEIDEEKCINCNLCEKVCPWKSDYPQKKEGISMENAENASNMLKCYAAKHVDKEIVAGSRSGGVFTALSDVVLDHKGCVYGAALDDDFVTRHHRAVSKPERDALKKSKYVQSEMGDSYEKVKRDLEVGKHVLFSGTACQCSGLKAYLSRAGVDMDKLILLDLVCAGVPSPKVFADYLNWLENKSKKKIESFEFRDKDKYAWGEGIEKVRYSNGKVKYQDYFTGSLFFEAWVRRECCFHCPWTRVEREADITLGDFWGVDKICREFYDDKGCNLVLVHSSKGEALLQKAKKDLLIQEVSREQAAHSQKHLYQPTDRPKDYDTFWEDYEKLPFDKVMKKYASNTVADSFFKKVIRKGLRFIRR